MSEMGRLLILVGFATVVLGVALIIFGRLPGNLVFRRGAVTVYVPLLASLVVSIVLTLLANLFLRR